MLPRAYVAELRGTRGAFGGGRVLYKEFKHETEIEGFESAATCLLFSLSLRSLINAADTSSSLFCELSTVATLFRCPSAVCSHFMARDT